MGAVVNAVRGGYSSAAPTGGGRAETDGETRDESMDRDELAAYLGGLREDLTGRHEGMRPASGPDRPRPVDGVSVEERSVRDDGGERRTVTLTWRDEGRPNDRRDGDG